MDQREREETWKEWHEIHPHPNIELRQWLQQSQSRMTDIRNQLDDLEGLLHTTKDPTILHETNAKKERLREQGVSLSRDRWHVWTSLILPSHHQMG